MDSKRLFDMLGGKIEFVIYNSLNELTGEIFEELEKEALRLQKIFNFYDEESELSILNKKRKLKVSDEMLEVIKKALVYCKLTNGKYDISLGKAFLRRKSGKGDVETSCSYKDIIISGNVIELKNKDVIIDLGSIAKGYIGDKIIEKMKELGVESGLVDVRGEIRIFGNVSEKIGIKDPRGGGNVDEFILKDKAVATSGDYNQFYASYDKSHIISNTDIASVSVISDNLMKADVLATAVFVSDDKYIKKIVKKHPQERFFIIKRDGSYLTFNWFKKVNR